MASVGIIIACYNSARFLPQTLQSVREQTLTDWKCVVVDDCSQDNSQEIIESACREDPRFSLLAMSKNSDTSAARNAGLAALGKTVRYVICLDSDDVWNASALQLLVDEIERHPSWIGIFGKCRTIDQNGTYFASDDVESAGAKRFDYHDGKLIRVNGDSETTFLQFLIRNPVVSPGCMLLRADAIANFTAGTSTLFDPKAKYGEDVATWLPLRRTGSIGYLDQTVLDYRIHGSNKSSRRWGMLIGLRKVRLKALHNMALERADFHQACAASRAYRKYRIHKALRALASYVYHRRICGIGRLFCCTVVDVLDIFIILVFQWIQAARIFVRSRDEAEWADGSHQLQPSGHLHDVLED